MKNYHTLPFGADRGAHPGRRLRRRRAGLRGHAGLVPRCGRPAAPAGPAATDDAAGTARGPRAGRRRAPARSGPGRRASRYPGPVVPGLLRAPVRRDRALRRGRHGVGRVCRGNADS